MRRPSRSFQVAGTFDKINLAGPPDVVVAVGAQPSVRAEGEAADLDRLEIAVVKGELRIGDAARHEQRRPTRQYHRPCHSARAAGRLDQRPRRHRYRPVQGPPLPLRSTAPAISTFAELRVAGDASFKITGPGGIRAAGGPSAPMRSLNGPGNLSLAGFETRDADISLVGPGDIDAPRHRHCRRPASPDSGDVTIAGGARCTISKTGPGDLLRSTRWTRG